MTSDIICSRDEKLILLQNYPNAGAVDMEAFYIAQYCTENNVPYILLKAISDTYNFNFPSYNLIKEKFTLSDYPKILSTMISKPQEVIDAIKLKYNCKKAIKNNHEFLKRYLKTFYQ